MALERCVLEYDPSLRVKVVSQQRHSPSLGRVDWDIRVNNVFQVLQEAKSPRVVNPVRAHLPPIGVYLSWS